MAWNEIKLNISAGMDFGDAAAQIKTIKEGIEGLKSGISEMPAVSKLLDASLQKSASVADSLSAKIEKLKTGDYKSEDERVSIERGAKNDVLELNTLRSLEFSKTDYSTAIAKQWFGGLPQSIQQQFDAMAPRITSLIRTRLSSLSKYGNGFTASSTSEIAKTLVNDNAVKQLMSQYGITGADSKAQMEQFIKYITPAATTVNRTGAYQMKRYGSTLTSDRLLDDRKPVDFFPESYKQTFQSKGMQQSTFDKSYQNMVLKTAARKRLDTLLASNPVAVQAAIASGISRRDDRGVLETRDEITRSQWENFRSALYDDLMIRASGYAARKVDPYSTATKDQRTFLNRLVSSTSGKAMNAMHDIESMESTDAWTNAAGLAGYSTTPNEGKRLLNQHVVTKYSPFVQGASPRQVMIPESQNTRILGNFKNNEDISDVVSIVSLAGYDANNPTHKKALSELFSTGKSINGKQFVAQSIHGTGDDTIVRMIEKGAYDRVNEEERKWINSHPDPAVRSIQGTYWNGYNDAEMQRRVQNLIEGKDGGATATDWGKYLEMRNKAWTPTSDLGLNLEGKRFAVVDTKGFGDGGAWFASSVMPHSGQFRGGIGLKGSAFVFQGNNMAAFGGKTGLLDEQGRLMMRGPDGQMYDVSGYDGIIPLDVVKNQGMLMDANGKFLSGPEASARMTAMVQRSGLGYHANYDVEKLSADSLGTQMASFINFSPAVRQHQIDMAMQRMTELDTESGMLKYVFGDKDDYLSRQVNPAFGGNSQLLATAEARTRVDNYRNSLYNDLIAGKLINFGEDDNKMGSLRAAASPLASMLLAQDGTIPQKTLERARFYIEQDAKQRGVEVPQYTDQQIKDMIILPQGSVLDFSHKNQDKVSVIRSPTGYGNMMHAKNLAAAAEPIYKGFGISTTAGIYLSEQDRDRLQGLDFDADEVKTIYDKDLATSIQETLKTMHFSKENVPTKPVEYSKEQLIDAAIQNQLVAERSLSATMGMGTGSAGIRIMQLDLSNPNNQRFIVGAQKMQGIYDTASTFPKKPMEYSLEGEQSVWDTLGLGKEYTKFSEKRNTLFQYDDNMLDEEGKVIENHPDIYTAANGQRVNMRALRAMGVDEINLPSRYMANHVMGVAAINKLFNVGGVDTSQYDAIAEAMDKQLGYGNAGPQRQALMKSVRALLTQFGTGERAYLSDSEARFLEDQRSAAKAELRLEAPKFYDPVKGKYIVDGHEYSTPESFVEYQGAKYGIRTATNFLENFGLVESPLRAMFGDNFDLTFKNTVSEIGVTAADSVKRIDEELAKVNKEIEDYGKPKDKLTANDKIITDEEGNKIIQNANGDLQYIQTTNPKNTGSANPVITPTVQSGGGIESADELFGTSTPSESSLTPTKEELTKRRDELLKQKENATKRLELSQQFNQLQSDLNAYNDELYVDQKGKENKILDEKTLAERRYNYLAYRTHDQLAPMDQFIKDLAGNTAIDQTTKDAYIAQAEMSRQKINENMQKSFTNGIILDAKNMYDGIAETLDKAVNAPSKQKQTIDKVDEKLKTSKESVGWMQNRLNQGLVDKKYQQNYVDAIKQTNDFINKTEEAKGQLIAQYTKENEINAKATLEGLQIKQGLKSKNSLSVRSNARLQDINKARDVVEQQYREGNFSEKEYQNMMSEFSNLEKAAKPVRIAMQDMFKPMKQEAKATFGYLSNMFTRKLFNAAIQETTNFVKQFDSSMNTIQMITIKSDEEISKLGSSLIDRAKELKVSVAEITSSAATLYRQGLSDQEVDERLEVVSKFSKVSGTKVDAATKLITVAMNTGLVKQAEEASDVVTALGDNAATNAAEIEKGIEKAGAAAAADGTSFAQLASMLTAITSTTQIGGNVAGRTLNTIIGRMNKIGTNELIYDENGNAVSGSAVAKLLESEGIRMYDERGNKRSTFDTLYALSQRWEGLSDAKQQQFANAIAGTRQYSNFAAIMQGMAEGKVDEYMQLAGESSGITDKKYEIYTKSLNASLTDLRNTWDGLVSDMSDSGALGGFISSITNMIQGVDNLTNSVGGLGGALAGVLPAIMLIGGLKSGSLAGLALAAGGYGILKILEAEGQKKTNKELYSDTINEINNQYSERIGLLSKAAELSKTSNKTDAQTSELKDILGSLSITVDETGKSDKEVEKAEQEAIKKATEETKNRRISQISDNTLQMARAASEEIDEITKQYDKEAHVDTKHVKKYFKQDENGNLDIQETLNAMADERSSSIGLEVPILGDALEFVGTLPVLKDGINGLRRAIGKEDLDFTNYWKYEKETLADVFYQANRLGTGEYSSWTSDQWVKFLDEAASGKRVPTEPFEYVDAYIEREEKKSKRQTAIDNGISDIFSSYFSELLPDMSTEEIGELSKFATKEIRNMMSQNSDLNFETAFNEVYRDFLGLDEENVTSETIADAAAKSLDERGYTSRRARLKSFDLEDAGENGYYIDLSKKPGEEGYVLSTEEAIKARQDDTRRYIVQTKPNEEGLVDTLSYVYQHDVRSQKAARELADNQKWYSYTDQKGKKHYSQDETALIEEASRYKENEALWKYSYTDQFGQLQERKGLTREQLQDFEQERLDNIKRQYTVKVGEDEIESFESYSDAIKARNDYNLQVNKNYQSALAQARTDQEKGQIATFTDILGYEHSYRGAFAAEKAEKARQRNLQNNQWLMLGENGEYMQGFATETSANKALQDRLAYYSSNENKRHFINGINVGSYDRAKELLESSSYYTTTDINGNPLIFKDWNEVLQYGSESRNNQDRLSKYMEKLADYASEEGAWRVGKDGRLISADIYHGIEKFGTINNKGQFVDSSGRVINSKHKDFDANYMTSEGYYKPLYDQYVLSNAPIEMKYNRGETALTYATEQIEKAPGYTVKNLADTWFNASEVKVDTPKLVSPVMGALSEITGQAVSDMAENLYGEMKEVAEEAVEVTEDFGAAKTSTSKFKAIKDYFLSNATSSYNAWLTDQSNVYATTADNMIRMIQDNNLGTVQDLLTYVNNNGIKEWSTLYSNANFGRLMSQITRDEHGNITSGQDKYNEILNFLYENSRDYGKQQVSFGDKYSEAYKAFNGLLGIGKTETGETYQRFFTSMEARDNVYQKEYEKYVRNLANISLTKDITSADEQRVLNYVKQANPYEAFVKDKLVGYVSEDQKEYLNEVLGTELTNELFNKKENLSTARQQYAETLLGNYQYGISGLTAKQKLEGLQSMLNMSGEEYRKEYASDALGYMISSAYGEGFSEFSHWQQLMSKDELSSEEKTELAAINESAANYLKTELEKLNFRYAGDKNASKLLQNYSTLLEGSMSERVAMLSPYISQGREMANVQDILSGNISTEADRKAISSLLGLSDKDVKNLAGSQQGKNKLQKLLDDKTGKMMEEFVKSFGVDIHSENLMADMQAEAALRGQDALDAVNSFFDIIESFTVDAEGHVTARAKEAPTTRAGDYYANAAEGYANQTRNARTAAWFRDNYDAMASLVGTSYIDQTGPLKWEKKTYDWQEAISKIAEEQGLDPEEFSEYWNNNVYGLQKAVENEFIDKDVLSLYNNAQVSGGKYKNNLDIALMKGLFGDNIDENGNFKADRINEIKQQMVDAVQDVDTGKFAMWTILAGDISQFADALQALENGDKDAAIDALTKVTETMNAARLDEMLKYMEVSKELPDILKNIAKGGADAEIAMVELDALFDEQYNQLVALEKVKGKAGKSLRGNDRTYFMSATGLKKAEVNELSADQVTALAEATEKKQVETIQNNLVALLRSPGEQLDFSKLIFGEGGTIDVSEAIKNLPSDVQTEWKRVQDTINKAVKDEYITINFPTLFKLAGYTSDKDIEKMVNQKDLKKAKETLTGTLDKLYSSMTADERSKLSFNTDLTIDTANLKPAQAAMVKEWNAYCKANPLVAAVAVSTTGGTGMSTSVTGGGYKTYADAFNALEGKSTEELTQIYLKDQIAVAVTGKKAYTTRRSGGGGGGGGNAIQKLLQDQQYEIKAKEHERKMAQIEQTKYNRLNNQDSYFTAINNEKTAIDNLEATQRKHISALEEQLKKAKEGSDEYKKLTEAINTAKEALANYENEIAEVQAKRIQFIQKQQENADKPKSHERTMFETLAEGSLSSDKFKDYEDYTTKNIAEISKQIKQNNDQKAQWEQELYNFTERSDEWIEVRDKIWGIEEETAQLENESVSKTLELNQQRLSQIAKVLQENTQQATHNQKIAGIYEGYYQQAGYRSDYERMIKEEQKANNVLLAENKKAEASARERMNAEKQGTTAYFEAQAAVYQYQEAIAQLEVSQLSLNRALAESKIDKVSEDYTDAVREVSHVNELLQSQAQEYLANNDYTSYTSAMERYLNNIPDILEAEKTALAELQAQYEEGIRNSSLDITMQRRLQDEINSREKAIQDLQIEQAQKERELDKANLDWMIENFDRDASNYSHNINLVQYQTTRYQNAGELTNYGNAIQQESALRAENVVRLAREIDALEQKRLDYQIKYGKGSDLEIEVVEQIKKREEALKSENVELEKNNKLLEENEQKIRQVRKMLEDAVDKEIEDDKRRKKEMLSANVSMQDNVLDVIRERYKEEWDQSGPYQSNCWNTLKLVYYNVA